MAKNIYEVGLYNPQGKYCLHRTIEIDESQNIEDFLDNDNGFREIIFKLNGRHINNPKMGDMKP